MFLEPIVPCPIPNFNMDPVRLSSSHAAITCRGGYGKENFTRQVCPDRIHFWKCLHICLGDVTRSSVHCSD